MAGPVIYYVRHGETAWNAEKRLQGKRDIPLNDLGRTQADRCGALLQGLFARDGRQAAEFDYVSSPLSRASETMRRLRAVLGLDPAAFRTDERLMEMSFGHWEGWTHPQVQARDAAGLAARSLDPWGFVIPGGESQAQLAARVGAWHDEIVRDTVVTAHGGVYRVLSTHRGIETVETVSTGLLGQGVVSILDHRGATLCE